MNGLITIATNGECLQRAVALSISAKRFGVPTVLLYARIQPSRYSTFFEEVVDVSKHMPINQSSTHRDRELKKLCYQYSQRYAACAFANANSLVIRDPAPMFRVLSEFGIHTPGGSVVAAKQAWATPSGLSAREVATAVGVGESSPIHTLNSGFLFWTRGHRAEKWFHRFESLFHDILETPQYSATKSVNDALCMSLAFAHLDIPLNFSDSSIGVWDAIDLQLCIKSEKFRCKKGHFWNGHVFHPFIANFGDGAPSALYRECVKYLQDTIEAASLPLFAPKPTGDAPNVLSSFICRAKFDAYSISREEYSAIIRYVKENNICSVLEFGPGASTWAFLEAGCKVVTCESNPRFLKHYRDVFKEYPEVKVIEYKDEAEIEIPQLGSACFDLGLVDGPVGLRPEDPRKFSRLNSSEFTSRRCSKWVLHDSLRPGEQETLRIFREKGWSLRPLAGHPKLTEVSRGLDTSAINSAQHATHKINSSESISYRSYDFSHWSSLPKVSCQCITFGRPELLNEAVESFLRQDYPGVKELVILNDSESVLLECYDDSQIYVENVRRRFRTIGEKRNACCALSTGDVILPWDDDDICLPWRISVTIEKMINRQYSKPSQLWYLGTDGLSIRKSMAHAMGGWSRELFDSVRGYPHIQSGQDQAIEGLFGKTGLRNVTQLTEHDVFYIYRFPGTGSYHLSAHGYGQGYDRAGKFVSENVRQGTYKISPHWKLDYVAMVQDAITSHSGKNGC
ncbi:Glycosyl transferase family 2 [Roseimaritima multifibrata]|uniref:Glycosyl transferase family 2 n=1 Tax=Roseimaritima multifibrata TaxID=1930274 RepID=A0A517M978_9BACT|nr:glycosyltransferase [Roseimaritima multifibrata]QDS91446.1 Glycosyl transferase family 2 [Roseimaritima multifibrata]